MHGAAPGDWEEQKIYGLKRGIDFIADPHNPINDVNLFRLYMLVIGNDLEEDERLLPGSHYRHDAVYIVGEEVGHQGLPHNKLPEYMTSFLSYVVAEDGSNDLVKSCILHFYFAYLHPYFNGNGKMARLQQLWFFVQRGYPVALFLPLSSLVNQSKSKYYKAFTQVEENARISHVIDATPLYPLLCGICF